MRIFYIGVFCFFCVFIGLTLPRNLIAVDCSINIAGTFDFETFTFSGKATYHFDETPDVAMAFHLPANNYRGTDLRSTYRLFFRENELTIKQRSELEGLNGYRERNLQTPRGIEIESVSWNDRDVPYTLWDNPLLPPSRNTRNTLLRIESNVAQDSIDRARQITIFFKTEFNDLPDDYARILWDFIPLPVYKGPKINDMRNVYKIPRSVSYNIRTLNGEEHQATDSAVGKTIMSTTVVPLCRWTYSSNRYNLFINGNYGKQLEFFKHRIENVLTTLMKTGWVERVELPFHFIIWDGALATAGKTVLLPRKLFRYAEIYYKLFEISILKGMVSSIVQQNFIISPFNHPWIIPAIQSEILRTYFEERFQGNTDYFPWGKWLNPEFFQENTARQWLDVKQTRNVIPAYYSRDALYLKNGYHSWYEKGFHLLRIADQSEESFNASGVGLKKKIKNRLFEPEDEVKTLTPEYFFELLEYSEQEKEIALTWLSNEGRVDYGVKEVTILDESGRYKVNVEISHSGTVVPYFMLEFRFKEGRKRFYRKGPGSYTFQFKDPPEEVKLDPKRYLLEDNLLNNSWSVPLKIRPIWDFPTVDQWLFTFTPLLRGNTFDKNLIGLSLNLKYLDSTNIFLEAWKGSGEQILWESSITQEGVPFYGSEITLASSELNASYTQSLTYQHAFIGNNLDPWFQISASNVELDKIDGETLSEDERRWYLLEGSYGMDLYHGDFTNWSIDLSLVRGQAKSAFSLQFQQHTVRQTIQRFIYETDVHLSLDRSTSYGNVPLQKKYPMGGPGALPGFPRETELLFPQRVIVEFGVSLPPVFTHSDLNLFRLGWLDNISSMLLFHWGEGADDEVHQSERFKDVVLEVTINVEWLNMYSGEGVLAVAQPLGHEKYRDPRIILFSEWVF